MGKGETMIRSSRAAVELIVAEEVSSKEVYEKKYQRPEWPGGSSGITVAIGYDLGYATRDRIFADWKDYLPPDVVRAMQGFAGLTGTNAHDRLAAARQLIIVPWNAAMAVFMTRDMPKWEGMVLKACPGAEKLPAGCFGVITGLAYNRGASFSKSGDRYTEMRNIRAHIAQGTWDRIPGELRSMKRLWQHPRVEGLINRREHEATLFERSLQAFTPGQAPVSNRIDTGDERDDVTPEGNEAEVDEKPLNVQEPKTAYSVEVETVQKVLTSMHYHEVGTVDGLSGGKLKGAIAAFMNDRGKPAYGELTDDFKHELDKALAEGWTRPIAPSRANATAKDIAPKVATVNQLWYQKLFAYVLGVPTAVTGGFKAIFGEQSTPTGYISAVKDFFGAIPAEFYWLGIAGIAVAIFIQAKKAQDATVKAFNRGEIN